VLRSENLRLLVVQEIQDRVANRGLANLRAALRALRSVHVAGLVLTFFAIVEFLEILAQLLVRIATANVLHHRLIELPADAILQLSNLLCPSLTHQVDRVAHQAQVLVAVVGRVSFVIDVDRIVTLVAEYSVGCNHSSKQHLRGVDLHHFAAQVLEHANGLLGHPKHAISECLSIFARLCAHLLPVFWHVAFAVVLEKLFLVHALVKAAHAVKHVGLDQHVRVNSVLGLEMLAQRYAHVPIRVNLGDFVRESAYGSDRDLLSALHVAKTLDIVVVKLCRLGECCKNRRLLTFGHLENVSIVDILHSYILSVVDPGIDHDEDPLGRRNVDHHI